MGKNSRGVEVACGVEFRLILSSELFEPSTSKPVAGLVLARALPVAGAGFSSLTAAYVCDFFRVVDQSSSSA